MTRYEKGFIEKCAEHGVSKNAAERLMKAAETRVWTAPPQSRISSFIEDLLFPIDKNHMLYDFDRVERPSIKELFKSIAKRVKRVRR